jgi:hypothetical protein
MPGLLLLRHRVALLPAVFLVGSGCGALLGLDDFENAPSSASTGAGAAASGGAGGSGASASGGTGGAPEPCEPGTMESCYEGPPGTETNGLCKAGTHTCSQDGVFGACNGQVLPEVERCSDEADEDCSGFDCARWSAIYGDAGNVFSAGVAATPGGDVYLAGNFSGSATFGSRTITAANNDAFLVALDGTGEAKWTRKIGAAGDQAIADVAAGPGNGVAVVGTFGSAFELEGITFSPGGSIDGWVARYAPDGQLAWVTQIGGTGQESVSGVAFTSDGNLVVVGGFDQTLHIEDFDLPSAGGYDGFVALLSGVTGGPIGVAVFGTPAVEGVRAVAVAADDSILITGTFDGGPLAFPPAGDVTATDGMDTFVAQLDPDLQAVWVRSFGGIGFQTSAAIAPAVGGAIYVTGRFEDVVDFGDQAGPLTAHGGGFGDAYLIKLTSSGATQWVRQAGGATAQVGASGIAAHPDGSVVTTLGFSGTLEQPVSLTADGADVLVIKTAGNGDPVWMRRIDGPGVQGAPHVAALEDDTLIAGSSNAPVDLGTGPLTGGAADNAWLARYAP